MNRYNRKKIHRNIYLFSLALLITCIPLSIYLTSIAQFLLVINWIFEGEFIDKWRRLRQNYSIIFFASVFVLYAVGYLYSENVSMGIERVKNALPLLALPIILGTSRSPGEKNVHRLLLLFSAGVTAAAFACIINYRINGIPSGDFRQISIILPHIRFAILIVMAIVILAYFATLRTAVISNSRHEIIIRTILLVNAFFLTGFLFFLRSATGVLILLFVAVVLTLNVSRRMLNKKVRTAGISLLTLVVLSSVFFVAYTWYHNFHTEDPTFSQLEDFTINGNPYFHDTVSGIMENGNFTGLYICEPELQREWEKLSTISYHEYDLKGQPVRSTLMRYLTSKGLRKDSVSIHRLSADDVHKIEHGLANYRFSTNPGIYQRFYETLYEIHVFQQSGFMEKHTFGQRIAFAVESFRLIRENLWTGVGTGDVFDSLLKQAVQDKSGIDREWEGKPHNQFAFFLIAFGIIGFLWIIFSWTYPVIQYRMTEYLLFNLFSLIILISMLAMDTLESSSSMVFFAFFYSLLVFAKNADQP